MKLLLHLLGSLIALVLVAGAGGADAARPNFVFLLADDLRADALGCYGNGIVRTPEIDRLAAGGVRFRNHFVTTSICNVSRASIFSGQHARRHGITNFATPFTEGQWGETYPARLGAAGWRTGFIGKFGVGGDAAVRGMSNRFDFWRGLPGQGGLFFEKADPARTHKTARFGNEAVEFIEGCEAGKPFCLSVSFNAPHARDRQAREFWPDAREETLYKDVMMPHPGKWEEEWFERLPGFVRESESRRRWGWRFTNEVMFQRTVKDYYRLITGIDREVGRIRAALEARGVGSNTVVVFTSDNGFFLGERGLADKWLMYEESIRVPLIVHDPRVPAGRRGAVVEEMTLNIDFAPTLLDWAGVKAPRGMQGRSVAPLVRGERVRGWRTEFFYEHHTLTNIIAASEGVRTERFKYLRWVNEVPVVEELYDLASDAGEERNLAGEAQHAKTLGLLRGRWEKLGRELR